MSKEVVGTKYDSNKPRVLIPERMVELLYEKNDDHLVKMVKDAISIVFDAGEVGDDWRLIAIAATEEVMQHGALKYGIDNWKYLANFQERYFSASIRHLASVFNGRSRADNEIDHLLDVDPDSGLPHWEHFTCNCMFKLWGNYEGARPQYPATGLDANTKEEDHE